MSDRLQQKQREEAGAAFNKSANATASDKRSSKDKAVALCVLVFHQGRTGEHYAIPTDHLPRLMRLSRGAVQAAIRAAIEHDWVRSTPTYLALKAGGIHVAKASHRFCQALLEETRGEVLRWAKVDSVAGRLGVDGREAILLASECAEAHYVKLDVKGPPYRVLPGSAILTEAGRQLLKTPAGHRPSKARQGKRRPGPGR